MVAVTWSSCWSAATTTGRASASCRSRVRSCRARQDWVCSGVSSCPAHRPASTIWSSAVTSSRPHSENPSGEFHLRLARQCGHPPPAQRNWPDSNQSLGYKVKPE